MSERSEYLIHEIQKQDSVSSIQEEFNILGSAGWSLITLMYKSNMSEVYGVFQRKSTDVTSNQITAKKVTITVDAD